MSTTATRPSTTRATASTNTLLEDLEQAIESYPRTYLTVDIYDVNEPGGAWNVGQNGTFKVRVRNDGPLNVDNLTLLMEGKNGSRVGEHGWTAGQISLETAVFPRVPGHMADDTWIEIEDHYHLFVHRELPPNSELLKVSVKDWDTSFDHLTIGHSDPAPAASDSYHAEVLGD